MSVLLHVCWGGTSHPCAKNQKAFSHLHMPQDKRTRSKKSMATLTDVVLFERHQYELEALLFHTCCGLRFQHALPENMRRVAICRKMNHSLTLTLLGNPFDPS